MTAAAIPGIITTLVGTGIQYAASEGENNRRESILRAAGEDNTRRSKVAENLSQENAKNYEAEPRQAALNEAETVAQTSLGQALTQSAARAPTDRAGRVSKDYSDYSDKSSADALGRSQVLANMMGKVRAPGDLGRRESIRNATVGSDVGNLATNASMAANAYGQDAGSVRANELAMFAGSGLQGYGTASASDAITSGERAKLIASMAGKQPYSAGIPQYGNARVIR